MSNYISREAFIADIEKRYCEPCEAEGKDYNHVRCRACWVDDMVCEIEGAPAADAVEVVRCKNCMFYAPYKKPVEDYEGYCIMHMVEIDEMEFCSLGEKRSNELDKR